MAVSKVVFGNNTIMDITDSTITADKVLEGEIAYAADGTRIVGTASGGGDLQPQVYRDNNGKFEPLYTRIGIVDDDIEHPIYIGPQVATLEQGVFVGWNGNKTTGGKSYILNNFNQPIYILSNNIGNLSAAFSGLKNFNQPVEIRAYNIYNNAPVVNGYTVFAECSALNSKINLRGPILPYHNTFRNCYNFNQPMVFKSCYNLPYKYNSIPKYHTALQLINTFRDCRNFDQPVYFKEYTLNGGSTTFGGCFMNCTNMASNIIFDIGDRTSTINIYSLLSGRNNSRRINIYFNNVEKFKSGASPSGSALTWTATTNGYYNATTNIYLLNNVLDAKNWFINYWHNFYNEYPDIDD